MSPTSHISSSHPSQSTLVDRLLKKFSPPLDSTLVLAIAFDYLDTPDAESNANQILSALVLDACSEPLCIPHIEPPPDSKSAPSGLLPDLVASQTRRHSLSSAGQLLDTAFNAASDPASAEEDYTSTDSTADSISSSIHHLQNLFPDEPPELLRDAVLKASDPGNLTEVVNLFLSAHESQHQVVFPGHAAANSKSLIICKDKGSKKDKRTKRGLETIHLTDVMRGDARARIQEVKEYGSPLATDNCWVLGESQMIYLSQLLDISPGKVNRVFHQNNCNMILAVHELLRELEQEKHIKHSGEDQDQMDTQLDFLRAIYEEHNDMLHSAFPADKDVALQRLLKVTNLDAGVAYELLLFLEDLRKSHGTVHFNFFHCLPADIGPSSSAASTSQLTELAQSDRSVVPLVADPIVQARRLAGSQTACQAKINQLFERKKALNEKLVDYRSGRSGLGIDKQFRRAIPLTYSQDAQRITQQIKEWELKAAHLRVSERQSKHGGDRDSIDLHGLTRNQALAVARDALDDWWFRSSRRPFQIITGAGTHSHNSIPVLLPAIRSDLDREGWNWKYEEQGHSASRGALIVIGRRV